MDFFPPPEVEVRISMWGLRKIRATELGVGGRLVRALYPVTVRREFGLLTETPRGRRHRDESSRPLCLVKHQRHGPSGLPCREPLLNIYILLRIHPAVSTTSAGQESQYILPKWRLHYARGVLHRGRMSRDQKTTRNYARTALSMCLRRRYTTPSLRPGCSTPARRSPSGPLEERTRQSSPP